MVQAVADRRYRSARDIRDRLALMETPRQRAADAFVDILEAAEVVENGAAKTTHITAGAAQIQVLIAYQDLLDRASATGLLTDGTQLSAGELRILACGADLIPAVLGTDSQVLDFGDTIRLAPPWLRRAIGLRDGGCAFPGCTPPDPTLRPPPRQTLARRRTHRPRQDRGPLQGPPRALRAETALSRTRRTAGGAGRLGRTDRPPRTPPSSCHPRHSTPLEHRSGELVTQPLCSTTTCTHERGDAGS